MPIELGIWRIDKGVIPVASSPIANEALLEDIVEQDLDILGLDLLLLIGRQVITAYGKRIDLLAMNSDGDMFVVELKKGRTPREIVAQTLDYGLWVQKLTADDITQLFEKYNDGLTFDEAFRKRFDQDPPEQLNENHNLIIVASELDASTERIVGYVHPYGVPINAVLFQHFTDGDRAYLARTWLRDPMELDGQPTTSTSQHRASRPPWNGQDFYVSFGDGEAFHDERRWEDAMKYGFVSAGGGRWFSRTLSLLFVGSRVFVHIPQKGYVGVGTVTESVQPVTDFTVEVEGRTVPILEAPLTASNMARFSDDPERSEYIVRVKWQKALPKDQAIWERGMYANENSATKLRHQFTLERLTERFGLDTLESAE